MRPAAPLLIIITLLMIACTVPASASYTMTDIIPGFGAIWQQKEEYNNIKTVIYDALPDDRITLVHFKVPQGSYVNFTLFYGVDSSVSGSAENHASGWGYTTASIDFNGQNKQYKYFDTNPEYDYNLAGMAKDSDTNQSGFIVYHAGLGSFDDNLAVFMPISSLSTNLIYKVSLSSPAEFDADITHADEVSVAQNAEKGVIDVAWDWINLAISMAAFVYEMVLALFYWLKFFFIDNLLMTIALYLTLTMAFAARASRGNIEKFLRRWIKDQVGLFNFILSLWNILVDIISKFRSIFKL